MSTNKSSESTKKKLTDCHTESDKIQPTALSEISVTIKSDELDEEDNKKGNKTFSDNNFMHSYRLKGLQKHFKINREL